MRTNSAPPASAVVNRLLGAALLLLLTAQASAQPAPVSAYESETTDGVVLAGKLNLEALRASHGGPIRVIDLRTEPEGTPEEAAAAAELGLEYTNIPVPGAVINPDQVTELRAALEGADEDTLVVVHCASGNRAGMLWGAMKLEEGVPLDRVREEVSGVVTKAPVSEALEAYSKSLDAGL